MYKVVDPIEKAGVPSLPVFVAAALIIVFLAATSIHMGGPAAPATTAFTIQVADQNTIAVDGAIVSITQDGAQVAGGIADSSGLFSAELETGTYELNISAANCESATQALAVSDDMGRTVAVTLACERTGAGPVSLCFSPTGIGSVNALVYRISGSEARFENKITDCGVDSCEITVQPGYKYKFEARGYVSEMFYSSDGLLSASEAVECIPLSVKADETPAEMGSVSVNVRQTDGTPVPGVTVRLVNPLDDAAAIEDGIGHTGYSGPSLGRVSFDLRVGTEFRIVIPADENSSFFRSNATYTVTDEPMEIDVVLNTSARTSFITQEKVAGLARPLPGTEIALFNSLDTLAGSGLTQSPDAQLIIGLNKDEAYRATFFKPGYSYIEKTVTGGSNNTVVLEQISAEQVGGIDVYVNFKGTEVPVQDATLTLVDTNNSKKTGYGMPTTNEDGYASFDWVLPGEYCIIVSRGEGEPTRCDDNPITVTANERVEKNIEIEPNNYKLRIDVLTQNGGKVWKADVSLINKFDDSAIASEQTLRDGHVTFDVPESTTVQALVSFKDANGTTFRQASETLFMDKNRAITIILVPMDNKVRFLGFETEAGTGDSTLVNIPQDQSNWQNQQQGQQSGGQNTGQAQGQGSGQGASGMATSRLGLATAMPWTQYGNEAPMLQAGKIYKAKFSLGLKNPVTGSPERWESVIYDALDELKAGSEYPLEFFPIATFDGATVSEGLPSNAETLTLSGNYDNADTTLQLVVPVRVRQVFNGTVEHSMKYKAQWNKGDLALKDPKTDWYTTPAFKLRAGYCKKYGDLGVCKYVGTTMQQDPSKYVGQLNGAVVVGLEITNEGSSDFSGSAKLTDELSTVNFQQTTAVTKVNAEGTATSLVRNRDFYVAPQEITINANEYTSLKHGDKLVILAAAQMVSPVKRTSIKATAADSDIGTYAFRVEGTVDAMVNINPELLFDLTPSLRFNITERVTLSDGSTVGGKMLDISEGRISPNGNAGISCKIPDIMNDGRMAGGTGHVSRDAEGNFILTLDKSCRLTTADGEGGLIFHAAGDFFKEIDQPEFVDTCLQTPALDEQSATATLKCPVTLNFAKETIEATGFEEGADCSFGSEARLNVKINDACTSITDSPAIVKIKAKSVKVMNCTADTCLTGGDGDKKVWFTYSKALEPSESKNVLLNIPVNASSAEGKIVSTYKINIPFKVTTKECIEDLPGDLGELQVDPVTACKINLNYGADVEPGYSNSDCSGGQATLNLKVKSACSSLTYGKLSASATDSRGNLCPAAIGTGGDPFCVVSTKGNSVTFNYDTTETLSDANPSKTFTLAVTIPTKSPETTKVLELPLKVKLRKCLLVRQGSELESPIIYPNSGCKITVNFKDSGSSDYSDADCSGGVAALDVVINKKECSTLAAGAISLDDTVSVLDADGRECGISKFCSAEINQNTIEFDYTTKTKPAKPDFTIKAKINTKAPDRQYDLELPIKIGTRASMARPPFQALQMQKYDDKPYDCIVNWCTPEQLLEYAGDVSSGYTTANAPLEDVKMVDVTLTSGQVLEIAKTIYSQKAGLIAGYPSVDAARSSPPTAPGQGQNLILFDINNVPKFGENRVEIKKGYLDTGKVYPYVFISFKYVSPSSETASKMNSAKGIQLYMPASAIMPGEPSLETEISTDYYPKNINDFLNSMWGLTSSQTHYSSGDHKIVLELCDTSHKSVCDALSERTGGDTSVPAIYRSSKDGTIHFVAEAATSGTNTDKLTNLITKLKEAVIDGKPTLEVRNVEKDGGYLTEITEHALRVYAVDKEHDGEAFTTKLMSDDSDLREKIKSAVAGYSRMDKDLITLTALTGDDIADAEYEYGPQVVIAICSKLDECLKMEPDGTTDNYYASDIIPEFKKEFGTNAGIPAASQGIKGGIYFVRPRTYSGYQGTVDVHYIFAPSLDTAKELLAVMGTPTYLSQWETATGTRKYIAIVEIFSTENLGAEGLYNSLRKTTADANRIVQVTADSSSQCLIGAAGTMDVTDTSGTNPTTKIYPGTTYFLTTKVADGRVTVYVKPLSAETKNDALGLCPPSREVFSDNFDDGSINDWLVAWNQGKGAVAADSNYVSSPSYGLHVTSTNACDRAYAAKAMNTLDYGRDYTVSLYYKPLAKNSYITVFENRHIMTSHKADGKFICNSAGTTKEISTFATNSIYKIEYRVQPAKNYYDVYINNAKAATCDFRPGGKGFGGQEIATMTNFAVGDSFAGWKVYPGGSCGGDLGYGNAAWDDIKITGFPAP